MSDLLQYMSHSDPQLKGNTAVLVGNLIHAALVESAGDFDAWNKVHETTGMTVVAHFSSVKTMILILQLLASSSCYFNR